MYASTISLFDDIVKIGNCGFLLLFLLLGFWLRFDLLCTKGRVRQIQSFWPNAESQLVGVTEGERGALRFVCLRMVRFPAF